MQALNKTLPPVPFDYERTSICKLEKQTTNLSEYLSSIKLPPLLPLTTEEVSSDRQIYINLIANPDPPSFHPYNFHLLSQPYSFKKGLVL